MTEKAYDVVSVGFRYVADSHTPDPFPGYISISPDSTT